VNKLNLEGDVNADNPGPVKFYGVGGADIQINDKLTNPIDGKTYRVTFTYPQYEDLTPVGISILAILQNYN
jgi:hypothetical protein